MQWFACATEINLDPKKGHVKRTDFFCAGATHHRSETTLLNTAPKGTAPTVEWLDVEPCNGHCKVWWARPGHYRPPFTAIESELYRQ